VIIPSLSSFGRKRAEEVAAFPILFEEVLPEIIVPLFCGVVPAEFVVAFVVAVLLNEIALFCTVPAGIRMTNKIGIKYKKYFPGLALCFGVNAAGKNMLEIISKAIAANQR
jgi:hypothetical protein